MAVPMLKRQAGSAADLPTLIRATGSAADLPTLRCECCGLDICGMGLDVFITLYNVRIRCTGGTYSNELVSGCCAAAIEISAGTLLTNANKSSATATNIGWVDRFFSLSGGCKGFSPSKQWDGFALRCVSGVLKTGNLGEVYLMNEATPGWRVRWPQYTFGTSVETGVWYDVGQGVVSPIPPQTTAGGVCYPTPGNEPHLEVKFEEI